jgi:hypothetical protein
MIEVHTVKLVKDALRREPQNVGVIASRPNVDGTRTVAYVFIGQRVDGSFSGRQIGVPKDLYQRWVFYFVDKLKEGRLGDIDRLRLARPTSFYLDHVVTLFDEEDPVDSAQRMYGRLVTDRSQDARSGFDLKVDQLLVEAKIRPQRNVSVRGELEGDDVDVTFGYSFENGQLHLMDKVVASPKPQSARKNANDFAWRAHLTQAAGTSSSFIAFTDLSNVPETYADNEFKSLFRVAHVADVSRPEQAIDTLQSLVRH